MNSKKHRKYLETAKGLPSYCIYPDDYHHSKDWGAKLVAGWINLKRAQVQCKWDVERFREALTDLVIELSGGWRDEFNDAARQEGMSFDCVSHEVQEQMYQAYVQANRKRAFELIPSSLHSELCWIPGWDGASLDDLADIFGQRSTRFKSNCLEDVVVDRWVEELLKLGNCSSDALREHCVSLGAKGEGYVVQADEIGLNVTEDPERPRLLEPEQIVTIIENAYTNAVPTVHAHINVRALFEHDCTAPMYWTTDRGKVHMGLHEGVYSGAGYMDTYDGFIVIPANEIGFAGQLRWNWNVTDVYWLATSYLRVVPSSTPPAAPLQKAA